MAESAIPGALPARLRLGLRQADVARTLGMHRQQYQAYESGKVEPSLQTAARIAEVLEITIDQLAGRVAGGGGEPSVPRPDGMAEGSGDSERPHGDRRTRRRRSDEGLDV